jgi:hypothetical protein
MRPQKITFGNMREMGVRGILVYCADFHCSPSVALSADRWPDDLRLSDIEPRFCLPCLRPARGRHPARLQLEQAADRCDGLPMRFCEKPIRRNKNGPSVGRAGAGVSLRRSRGAK